MMDKRLIYFFVLLCLGSLKLKQIYFLSVGSGEDKSFLLKYWDMLEAPLMGTSRRLFLHKGNVICEPSRALGTF